MLQLLINSVALILLPRFLPLLCALALALLELLICIFNAYLELVLDLVTTLPICAIAGQLQFV